MDFMSVLLVLFIVVSIVALALITYKDVKKKNWNEVFVTIFSLFI